MPNESNRKFALKRGARSSACLKPNRTGKGRVERESSPKGDWHATTACLPDGTVVVRFIPHGKTPVRELRYGKEGRSIALRPMAKRHLHSFISDKSLDFFRTIHKGMLVAELDKQEQVDPMAEIDSAEELPTRERDMSDVEAELHAALSPSEMVGRMGLTRAAISNQRNAGKILGLRKGNRYVFPSWQLDQSGQPHGALKQILDTLKIASKDPINLLIYMITGLDFYEGKSIKDFLIAGDTESALSVARTIARK